MPGNPTGTVQPSEAKSAGVVPVGVVGVGLGRRAGRKQDSANGSLTN
jgi:hypothetical protein